MVCANCFSNFPSNKKFCPKCGCGKKVDKSRIPKSQLEAQKKYSSIKKPPAKIRRQDIEEKPAINYQTPITNTETKNQEENFSLQTQIKTPQGSSTVENNPAQQPQTPVAHSSTPPKQVDDDSVLSSTLKTSLKPSTKTIEPDFPKPTARIIPSIKPILKQQTKKTRDTEAEEPSFFKKAFTFAIKYFFVTVLLLKFAPGFFLFFLFLAICLHLINLYNKANDANKQTKPIDTDTHSLQTQRTPKKSASVSNGPAITAKGLEGLLSYLLTSKKAFILYFAIAVFALWFNTNNAFKLDRAAQLIKQGNYEQAHQILEKFNSSKIKDFNEGFYPKQSLSEYEIDIKNLTDEEFQYLKKGLIEKIAQNENKPYLGDKLTRLSKLDNLDNIRKYTQQEMQLKKDFLKDIDSSTGSFIPLENHLKSETSRTYQHINTTYYIHYDTGIASITTTYYLINAYNLKTTKQVKANYYIKLKMLNNIRYYQPNPN